YVMIFFFQAEDGIRDATVTGVQTCALPISFLSVTRGKGPNALPALIKVTNKGTVEAMPLKSVKFSKASLGALTDNPRYKQDALTHIGYIKGTVYVAALSNEQFSSSL